MTVYDKKTIRLVVTMAHNGERIYVRTDDPEYVLAHMGGPGLEWLWAATGNRRINTAHVSEAQIEYESSEGDRWVEA